MVYYAYELAEQSVHSSIRPHKRARKHCFDYGTTTLLLAVWACLFLIGGVLLGFTSYTSSTGSDAGKYVTSDEVVSTIALSTLPVLVAAILNEILVDRAWRRIIYFALGRKIRTLDYATQAKHLRAANLDLWTFIKRFFKCKLTKREYRSAASYALMRWGTTLSIASAQLAVGWKPSPQGYIANKRRYMLILPFLIHAGSIFLAVSIWRAPWSFLSDRYNDHGLLKKYQPYLDNVQGSLATFEEVAQALERAHMNLLLDNGMSLQPPILSRITVSSKIRTGRQIWPKIKGLSWGLSMMFVPPALAWGFLKTEHTLTLHEYRFAFSLVFLSQNVFYVQAMDFAIWNISLDGFCKTPKARPNRNMRYLGFSSGTMVFIRACRQRRPLRAALFLWLFWLQACGMRLLSVVYSLSVTVLSYYSLADMSDVLDPNFWIGWLIITLVLAMPPFVVWIFKKVDAPICSVDGWRWAQIAQKALHEDGFYGIQDQRAIWGMEVELFGAHDGERVV